MSSELKTQLRGASRGPSRPMDMDAIWKIARRRTKRARGAAAVAACALLATSSLVVTRTDLLDRTDGAPAAEVKVTKTCKLERVKCISLHREGLYPLGTGFGSVWVGNVGLDERFGIARIDARTGVSTSRIPTPGFVNSFAVDDRWMWALLDRHVLQIDPLSETVVKRFDIWPRSETYDSSFVSDGRQVWVSGPNGKVMRISPDEDSPTTYSYSELLPGYRGWRGALHLSYGDGVLLLAWGRAYLGVVDPQTGELLRVDPQTWNVMAEDIAVANGYVWATLRNDVFYWKHQDPPKGISTSVTVGDGYLGKPIPYQGAIWVLEDDDYRNDAPWPHRTTLRRALLTRIDVKSKEILGKPVPLERSAVYDGFAAGEGYVWVATNTGDTGVLYRIKT